MLVHRLVIEPAELDAFSYSVFEDRSSGIVEHRHAPELSSDVAEKRMAGFQRVASSKLVRSHMPT